MGTTQQIKVPFDMSGKIESSHTNELRVLDHKLTENEIHAAIKNMQSGKASGPDGFPIEFYQKFWIIIKTDLLQLVHAFEEHETDLTPINKATTVLIPKIENPTAKNHYRPISVINTIVNIITKVYAERLQQILPNIITEGQSAFVKGRGIMEPFVIARELVHLYNKRSTGHPIQGGFQKSI
jgi:Reverse transcriptase (RNA-dependent DNA polymerase)